MAKYSDQQPAFSALSKIVIVPVAVWTRGAGAGAGAGNHFRILAAIGGPLDGVSCGPWTTLLLVPSTKCCSVLYCTVLYYLLRLRKQV